VPSAQSYWQKKNARYQRIASLALPLAIIGIIGSRFYIPMGIMFYLAAWCFTYRIQDQMHPKWDLVEAARASFRHPKLGLSGEPGENTGWRAIWPPNRVANINAAIIATLWAVIVPQALPVLSGCGIYMLIVAIAQTRRTAGYNGTPYPTSLVDRHNIQDAITSDTANLVMSSTSFFWGAACMAGATIGLKVLINKWVPTQNQIRYARYANIDLAHYGFHPSIITIAILGLVGGLSASWFVISHFIENLIRTPWKEQQDIASQWSQRWEAIGKIPDVPIYRGEVKKPSEENWTHTVVVFQTPSGTDYSQFSGFADNLASSLEPDIVLVAPLPMADESGAGIPGTAQTLGFKVAYAKGPMGERPWLRTDLDEETLGFVFQWAMKNALNGMKLPAMIWAYNRVLYKGTDKDRIIVETQWKLPPGLPQEELTKRTTLLQDKLEVPWLRIGRRQNTAFVSVVYGINPMPVREELETVIDRNSLHFIDSINWDYILRTCKIYNPEGQVPPYISTEPANQDLKIHTFGAISGLPMSVIQAARHSLVPTIGARFVDIEPSNEVGGFHIITGDQDPLDRLYQFVDYLDDPRDPLIKPPGEEPEIEFKIGVGADGNVVNFVHDNESPHLVIAGASGQGKSNLIHSMVLQMAMKNTPDQWELRIAEPKNELQRYKGLPHVTRFVDMHTPANNHYEPVKDMLCELYEEMERRYALFLRLPTKPQKLEQALRDPGLKEKLPYITCLIEECADYFSRPEDRDERADYLKLLYYLNWLVRKARGAGIYIVAATQRPSKENIPTQVKANARRIGLGTNTMVDSQIIIDQPGLEEIRTKGRGMVSSYGGYRGFRAFYFDERPGGHNSLARFLEPLELLSGYRSLGSTAVYESQYPLHEQSQDTQ